jgi:hypothetical protein
VRAAFESWLKPQGGCTCGALLSTWCDDHLRRRFPCSLHFDLALRGGETSKVVRYGLESTNRHLKGNLWDTKTHPGVLSSWSVRHSCQDYQPEWCTVCLFDAWWLRFGDQPAKLNVDVRCLGDKSPDTSPIWTCGLFLFLYPEKLTGLRPALGKDACSKLVKACFTDAGYDPRWTTHKGRGMVTSKVVNMGLPWGVATIRGRWAETSDTFQKSYFRKTTFLEFSHDNATKSFEFVVRLKETILSYFFNQLGRYNLIPRFSFVEVLC